MKPNLLIQGDGVAARCCARLLAQGGFTPAIERAPRPRVPVILLSDPALELIAGTFGLNRAFEGLPRITRRVVAWGAGARPVAVEHTAIAISEEALLERLGVAAAAPTDAEEPRWRICSAKPLPAETAEHRFGARVAMTMRVELKAGATAETCWMEALPEGWLFLATDSPGSGWLAAAGARPELLLESSRLIRTQVAHAAPATAAFAVSPRIADPLGAPGWLACGSAAMGFDPICGDGTAHAVREAILASAVVKAAERGGDVEALLKHYQDRLTAGFLRHLLHCLQYYSTGGETDWWREEAAATRRGIEWCGAKLKGEPKYRYRLNGFELEPAG